MYILSETEIQNFADELCFTYNQAKEIVNLFIKLHTKGNADGKKIEELNNYNDYISFYENYCSRSDSLYKCYQEDMNGAWIEPLNMSFEEYKTFTFNTIVFELNNEKMVIEICW